MNKIKNRRQIGDRRRGDGKPKIHDDKGQTIRVRIRVRFRIRVRVRVRVRVGVRIGVKVRVRVRVREG